MRGEYLSTEYTQDDAIIMYIHGGGFISGTSRTHRAHVSKFVKQSGIPAIVFDYRLAPEHPFPAALEDCVSAYRWLLDVKGYRPEQIVIAGESAGGTLTLSTLLKAKQENLQQPAGAVAISPATDLRCLADSFERNASKDIAPYNSWKIWTGFFFADHDLEDPFLSPLFGDFKQIAPLYLCIGTHEIYYDDTQNLHNRVQECGGMSDLHIYDKMVHAFPILAPAFPEATAALKDICAFINKQLADG
jgi:acetyl esterase/lipase